MKQLRINRKVILIVALVMLLLIGVTGSFAWFSFVNRLNTVSLVQIPSRITISGANRSEMQRISLEMTDDDFQDGNTVTVRRVFCIESTDDFYLEVAHTTNINNMNIKIYPVSNMNSNLPAKKSGEGVVSIKGLDGTTAYYYSPDSTAISGSYLNPDSSDATIAAATGNAHEETYLTEDEGKIQKNAEPLYWLSTNAEDYDKNGYATRGQASDGETEIYYRYYVLELSWDSQTQETDMVYLIASHKN